MLTRFPSQPKLVLRPLQLFLEKNIPKTFPYVPYTCAGSSGTNSWRKSPKSRLSIIMNLLTQIHVKKGFISPAELQIGTHLLQAHAGHKCTDVDMKCTWSKSMCISYADSRRLSADFRRLSADFRRLSQTFRRLSQTFRRLMCTSYADSENICAYMKRPPTKSQHPGISMLFSRKYKKVAKYFEI